MTHRSAAARRAPRGAHRRPFILSRPDAPAARVTYDGRRDTCIQRTRREPHYDARQIRVDRVSSSTRCRTDEA